MENQAVSPALEMHIVMNSEGTTKKTPPMDTPRARLLRSCGESILSMARNAYQRVETMRCPVGCVARGVSRAAAPVLSPLRRRCLAALTFADRQLLVVQDVAAVLFPATERILGKADDLVLLVDSLPARLDGAFDGIEALVADAAGMFVIPKRRCRYHADDDGAFRDVWCNEEDGESLHRAMKETRKNSDDVARKVESLEVVTAVGDKALVDVKGESKGDATPEKRGGASDGEECDVEDVQEVETPGAEITEISKDDAQEAASHERGSSEREEEAVAAMAGGSESREETLLGLFDTAWQQKLA